MSTAVVKRIVCLANSRKPQGRCIAGKEILEDNQLGGWIRPVSDRPGEEVSQIERQYENGGEPQLLDVIDIPLRFALPKNHQRENWLLDPDQRWRKVGQIQPSESTQFVDQDYRLWVDDHSTANGMNDRVPFSSANFLNDSLRFIRVSGIELVISQPGQAFGRNRRRLQGRFRYHNADYWLWVTDPIYERQYFRQPNGNYSIGQCFLTVSLGEPYNDGYVYKLVAAIVEP